MTLSENHVPIAHGPGFFPQLFEPFKSLGASIAGFFSPSADAADATDSYELNLELPGVKEEDIDITLQNDILSIKGEKRAEREEKTKSYYFSERSYGRFERSFRVPSDVVEDKIGAQFGDGVLKVTLPRNAPKELAVKKVAIKK
jgi:HSP20 family protein